MLSEKGPTHKYAYIHSMIELVDKSFVLGDEPWTLSKQKKNVAVNISSGKCWCRFQQAAPPEPNPFHLRLLTVKIFYVVLSLVCQKSLIDSM